MKLPSFNADASLVATFSRGHIRFPVEMADNIPGERTLEAQFFGPIQQCDWVCHAVCDSYTRPHECHLECGYQCGPIHSVRSVI